jgi:hypothetical protein
MLRTLVSKYLIPAFTKRLHSIRIRRYSTHSQESNAASKETESHLPDKQQTDKTQQQPSTTDSKKQEIKQLETWLFAKKYTILDPTKPLAQQIPEDAQFLFGRRVIYFFSHTQKRAKLTNDSLLWCFCSLCLARSTLPQRRLGDSILWRLCNFSCGNNY